MKKAIVPIIVLLILASGTFAVRRYQEQGKSAATGSLQTETVRSGDLTASVTATGTVRSNQEAWLAWRTSGIVGQVNAAVGDRVSAGQTLAKLDPSSLPQQIILARADLITSQKALDDLKNSELQRAQALKAVEDAQQAFDDAQNPVLAQARSQATLAEAQKNVGNAYGLVDILTTPASQSALDQAYANMLMAKNVLDRTKENIDRIQKRLNKNPSNYLFFESRSLYRRILQNLQFKLANDQIAYEKALNQYNRLLEPPDENEVASAKANLQLAQAQLSQAQSDWERTKEGSSPAEVALLKARLEDAQREWERLKEGPDPRDITAGEAQVAAAQAALSQVLIAAPFDGVINDVRVKPGDLVNAQQQAFLLDDISKLLVDLQVSEIDITQIRLNQPVELAFDAIPGKKYHGQITQVSVTGNVIQDVVSFPVIVTLTDADDMIRLAMSASATIQVSEVKNALLVPNSALRYVNGKRVVYVLKGGQPVPLEITLGISSDRYSQVLSGDIRVGDQVILNPPGDQAGN